MTLIHRIVSLFLITLGLISPTLAQAFDLDELHTQLRATPVARGQFTQEKHLRALAKPLVSRGDFVLATDTGMLWQLRTPLAQTLRMTNNGIARQLDDGSWQTSVEGNHRESKLFLDLLGGNTSGLSTNFDLALTGTASDWQMTMTPNSAILKQIFTHILVQGGAVVQKIELLEKQGDRTVLHIENVRAADSLNKDELRALSD